MSTHSIWSAGRYESVAERISGIAERVVATADRRRPLRGTAVVDLACGTGSAALAAARHGARVTAVDLTPELLEQARAKAGDLDVTWVAADAAATGLPEAAFDVAVSNMGIIFVDPTRQVDELARLLTPGGALVFSSWVRDVANPFYDPIVDVLGAPPARGFSPDQWGDPAVVAERLHASFTDVEIENDVLTWQFDALETALHFLEHESPMHVAVFGNVDDTQRARLRDAFAEALRPNVTDDGVAFDASYAVVTASRAG
jgi:SAM-dependent methyltransferase